MSPVPTGYVLGVLLPCDSWGIFTDLVGDREVMGLTRSNGAINEMDRVHHGGQVRGEESDDRVHNGRTIMLEKLT